MQEVFQDACENYYADEASVAPMVLVGVEHWTHTLPAWPLLQALERPGGTLIEVMLDPEVITTRGTLSAITAQGLEAQRG